MKITRILFAAALAGLLTTAGCGGGDDPLSAGADAGRADRPAADAPTGGENKEVKVCDLITAEEVAKFTGRQDLEESPIHTGISGHLDGGGWDCQYLGPSVFQVRALVLKKKYTKAEFAQVVATKANAGATPVEGIGDAAVLVTLQGQEIWVHQGTYVFTVSTAAPATDPMHKKDEEIMRKVAQEVVVGLK